MTTTLLIANRGEIAIRIARTARAMGLRSLAVFSDADAGAAHVAACDAALPIGPAPARDSYLSVPAILAAAARGGADMVHPGYGFLSENAGFAEACAGAGLVFVGPPPAAIAAMGSKAGARRIMAAAGVPLVPGYDGEDQSADALRAAAEQVGYPVLLKASAGGGGRGMRVVETPERLAAAIESARREAGSAFGDERLLLERYLHRPRHIEVQVFADSHGNVVHLFERDCSLQRRHQKVIEEAPAPSLAPEVRAALGRAAVAAARAIGYCGAGTVEFVLDAAGFYFIEMNTRLQVEHPVTEMITGIDLVEWQIRVACGETLPLPQDRIALSGHAIEARLYAEDPARRFLPQSGRLVRLRFPGGDPGLRVDSGVREGDTVSIHYDPMIAKLIAHGDDRDTARRRLIAALERTALAGIRANRAFLAGALAHPAFAAGDLDTGFIGRHGEALRSAGRMKPDRALPLGALAHLLRQAAARAEAAARSPDPHAPWHQMDGFRLNDTGHLDLRLRLDGGEEQGLRVEFAGEGWRILGEDGAHRVSGTLGADGRLRGWIDGAPVSAWVTAIGERLHLQQGGEEAGIAIIDPLSLAGAAGDVGGRLSAPMPGKVLQLLVAAGDRVARGAPLLVLEAMKMEHVIAAPADGVVTALRFGVGEQVEEGVELVGFEASDGG